MTLSATERPKSMFDVGPIEVSPATGYTKVSPKDFVGTRIAAYQYSTQPILGDFVSATEATFTKAMPSGAYFVKIVCNDSKYDHYTQKFVINGDLIGPFGLSHTAPFEQTFWTMVKNDKFELQMGDGQSDCVLNAVEIVPTDKSRPLPPTPLESATAKWEENMVKYGWDLVAKLKAIPAVTGCPFGDTFYDAARVLYQIADYTKNTDPIWYDGAKQACLLYRLGYVDHNNGGVQGYWVFTEGLREDYKRTKDEASKKSLMMLATNSWATHDNAKPGDLASVAACREVAYAIEAHLDAEKLGSPHRAQTDKLVGHALNHINDWLLDPRPNKYFYIRPFMVGLTCNALIDYDEAYPDPRILPAIHSILARTWETCWLPDSRCFRYTDTIVDSPNDDMMPTADLNLLVAPAYAWVYKKTKDTAWRDKADVIFMGGVDGAWLGASKQVCQQYRWSFKYLEWRGTDEVVVPPKKYRLRLHID